MPIPPMHLELEMYPLSNWVRTWAKGLWRFRLPILAGLFLISPVLIFDVGLSILNGRGIDKQAIFAIPASVFWLMAAYGLFRKVWVANLILFPFYISTIADLYLISNYDMRLTSSTLSVMLENSVSVGDFARTATPLTVAAVPALVIAFGLLTFSMRGLTIRSWRCLQIAAVGLVLTYASVSAARINHYSGHIGLALADVVAHDVGSPFGVFPQGYIAYQVYQDAIEYQRQAASFTFGATRPAEPLESEIYVLVVGESSRRDHWSLYGYAKPTTPRLARTPNVIPFEDVVAQEALTQVSVPLMITRRSLEHPHDHLNEKSIISAFREVGFRTYWVSTQKRDHWTGPINRYSGEAHHVVFFERRNDMVLVDTLRDALAKMPDDGKKQKLFFLLHTEGSHFVYKDRYPEATAPFDPIGTDKEKTIIEYDNSIEYMDNVLSQLITTLSEYRGLTALLYMSDHAENLYDDNRMLLGHFLENEYDIPIPAFLWTSRSYTERHQEMVAAAKRNSALPLNTRMAFSTLAQMAGMEIPGMDLSKLSVFSASMQPGPRFFYKQGAVMDYDKWVRSSRVETQLQRAQSSN